MEASPVTTVVSTSLTESSSNATYCATPPSPSESQKGLSATPQLHRCSYTPAAERSGTMLHEGGDPDKG